MARPSKPLSDVVYHITSSLKLPWIIESGELRPHTNNLPGIGAITYLWATGNRAGDRTAQAARYVEAHELAWREDLFRPVRLTLSADGFLTWNEVIGIEGYSDDQVATLVEFDRREFGEFGQHLWRCRKDPLPLARIIKAETQTHRGRWRPIPLERGRIVRTANPECMGYRIGREVHYSVRVLVEREGDDPPYYAHRPLFLDSDELADQYTVERLDHDQGEGEDEYEVAE